MGELYYLVSSYRVEETIATEKITTSEYLFSIFMKNKTLIPAEHRVLEVHASRCLRGLLRYGHEQSIRSPQELSNVQRTDHGQSESVHVKQFLLAQPFFSEYPDYSHSLHHLYLEWLMLFTFPVGSQFPFTRLLVLPSPCNFEARELISVPHH